MGVVFASHSTSLDRFIVHPMATPDGSSRRCRRRLQEPPWQLQHVNGLPGAWATATYDAA
jgi:hypothetical protein